MVDAADCLGRWPTERGATLMPRAAQVWSTHRLRQISDLRRDGVSWRAIGELLGLHHETCRRAVSVRPDMKGERNGTIARRHT